MKFLHSMIRVKDIDASLKFYTEILNMKLAKKRRLEDCELYFLDDESGCCQLELTYNDDTPKDGYVNGNAFGHFAFSVKSFDEFTKKMEKYGLKYLYEPFDLNGKGTSIAFILDPDGNEIELIEKIKW